MTFKKATFRETAKEAWDELTIDDLAAFVLVLVILILMTALGAMFG